MNIPRKLTEYLLGKSLRTQAIVTERLSNMQALPIFGADALSSIAYATEEILFVLALAGSGAFSNSIPIALAIVCLIIIVTISYQQVIHAYPRGGGVYNVARQNLGEIPALIGAASLLVDYILTAAVSAAAGVAALTSAFPILFPYRVPLGIGFITFIMWMNLRGVREAGKIFSYPTYLFIVSFIGMIGYGVWRSIHGTFPINTSSGSLTGSLGIMGIVLIFHAFAAGCTAMTGIEATSNGVQAFKPPESKNASRTLLVMAIILITIFVGITFLAYWGHINPSHSETVISQIARGLFGKNMFYFLIQGTTMLILFLAANTPFADFPRVASQLAHDGYFPKRFLNLGSRLVFSHGIIALAILAALLIYSFQGSVHALIPLYAVGVFLGFSLSQLGMIIHWIAQRDEKHRWRKIAINTIGFTATSLVFIIVLVSKFTHGAWFLIPALILLFLGMKKIKSHYIWVANILRVNGNSNKPIAEKEIVFLLTDINQATLRTLNFIKSLNPLSIHAVHVAVDPEEGELLKQKWGKWALDVPLDVLLSEYRDLIGPILEYLHNLERKTHHNLIVVTTELILPKFWQHFLHNQTSRHILKAIQEDPNIEVEILEIPVKVTSNV